MRRVVVKLIFAALLAAGHGAVPRSDCGTQAQGKGGTGKACEVDLGKCSPPTQRLVVPEKVVLVMGNTGCGKSTLTKHLSHHDEEMMAVKEDDDGYEFLINGTGIGSSMASVTTVPELFADKTNSINYYDCPGFEDTRGSCVEVSTTYYMKDIVRHARHVKVLLLTPHYAVTAGQDRADLLTMLKNAAQVFLNVPAVKDSLALVVTKVSSIVEVDDDEWAPTPEEDIQAQAASFLRNAMLPFLRSMAKKEKTDSAIYLRAADIVNALLVTENGAYARIGVFRTPDEEAPLRGMELMERGRDSLLRLVEGIRYARVQAADFGFAVSDRTKLFALERARALSAEVAAKLSSLGIAVQAGREREARTATDVPARAASLQNAAAQVRAAATRLGQSAGVQDFCGRVLDEVQGDTAHARAEEVAAACQQLDVLQVVADKPLVGAAVVDSQWARPLRDAADTLDAQAAWQRTLAAAYDRLTKYDVLSRGVKKLHHLPVGAGNVAQWEQKLLSLGLTAQLQSPVANLTELNALLTTVSQGASVERPARGHVVVRGDSVLLSEAVAALGAECAGGRQRCVVEVYATNTIFVDGDVTLPGAHLVLVAPRVEAVGHPTINLDGLPGVAPERQPREGRNGQRGTAGRPGAPGLPGGSFLAVAAEVVGKVSVSASGGRGGDGQRGGNGGPGTPGGGHGGAGGNGGAGGLGGLRGRVRVIPVGSSASASSIRLSALEGKLGGGGRGGLGGDARAFTGSVSRSKRAIGAIILSVLAITAVVGVGVAIHKSQKRDPPPPPPVPTFNRGAPGVDGAVTDGRESPTSGGAVPWAAVPARARTYLQLNLTHQYRSKEIKEFLKLLSENRDFQGLER